MTATKHDRNEETLRVCDKTDFGKIKTCQKARRPMFKLFSGQSPASPEKNQKLRKTSGPPPFGHFPAFSHPAVPLWDHFKTALAPLWNHFGNRLDLDGTSMGTSRGLLWDSFGTSVGPHWDLSILTPYGRRIRWSNLAS